MTDQELKDASADLRMLWGDVEWWQEQGLSHIRPTLKSAAEAMAALRDERDAAIADRDVLLAMVASLRSIGRPYEQWHAHWAQLGGRFLELLQRIKDE